MIKNASCDTLCAVRCLTQVNPKGHRNDKMRSHIHLFYANVLFQRDMMTSMTQGRNIYSGVTIDRFQLKL